MAERKPRGYWNYETCLEEAKKYKTRGEFAQNCKSAYNLALSCGWFADYDWLADSKTRKKWNYDSCKAEARKYKSRSEFSNNNASAYDTARRNGWLDEYDWFEEKQKPSGFWTYDNCKGEAKKYTSRGEFCNCSSSAYHVALQRGWLDDYVWFERPANWNEKWNYENCKSEAKKYHSRSEFQKGNASAYNVARLNKWLDDFNWLEEKHKPNGYWNYDNCKKEAKKYISKKDFEKGSGSAYNVARENHWLDDYDWFEEKQKPSGFWTYDNCKEEARKYSTRTEFQKGNGSAYTSARVNKWLDDFYWLENKQLFINPNGRWFKVYSYTWKDLNAIYVGITIQTLKERDKGHRQAGCTVFEFSEKNSTQIPDIEFIEDCLLPKQAGPREQYYIDKYKKEGWNVINKAMAGSLGGFGAGKWNKNSCEREAKKYKSRGDFKNANNNAYTVARKNGWLNNYDWFEEKQKPSGYWNFENCLEEAKKYKSRGDFQKKSGSAYIVARKNGWLDNYDWFEEKIRRSYWNYDTCLVEARKYKSRTAFNDNCSGAYNVARKNGWLDNYDWFEEKQKPSGFWTYDNCKEEAKKYKSRHDFLKGNNGAYNTSNKNGWLDDFFGSNNRKTKNYWTFETCMEEAKNFKSRSEFSKGNICAYNVSRKNGWLDSYDWFEPSKSAQKWNYDTCKKEAKKYKSRSEFNDKCTRAYDVARRNGWLDDFEWLSRPEVHNKKWTFDTCREESKKYKSRSEFQDGSCGAYNVARRNGWLDEYDWLKKKK